MKAFIPIACLILAILTSCNLLKSDTSSPPDPEGWFEIKVPLGEKKNAYNIMGLHFLNCNTGWIVGRKTAEVGTQAYLGFTENGGRDWNFSDVGKATKLRSVYFHNRKEGVAVNGTIEVTEDGGKTWTHRTIQKGEPSRGVYELAFGSAQIGWATGPFGAIAKTSDGGITWQFQDVGHKETYFEAIEAKGNRFAWALSNSDSGLLLKTTDGGSTWQEINLQDAIQAPPVRYHGLTFSDTSRGWAVGEFRRILHTEDGGETWELQYPKTASQQGFDGFLTIDAFDSLNALAGTGHGSMVRTSDGGKTWQEQLPTQNNMGSFHKVQFIDAELAYAIGGDRLMKTVTGGKVSSKIEN